MNCSGRSVNSILQREEDDEGREGGGREEEKDEMEASQWLDALTSENKKIYYKYCIYILTREDSSSFDTDYSKLRIVFTYEMCFD